MSIPKPTAGATAGPGLADSSAEPSQASADQTRIHTSPHDPSQHPHPALALHDDDPPMPHPLCGDGATGDIASVSSAPSTVVVDEAEPAKGEGEPADERHARGGVKHEKEAMTPTASGAEEDVIWVEWDGPE